jgi:PAS domain S-box-containing protein
MVLGKLPVDFTFVDENDQVRFYSNSPDRVFVRTPAVIGRKVQNCHPQNSVHVVQKILDDFRAGTRDRAEFWLETGGRFVHIRYFPLRSPSGEYRGVLEMVQDITDIRKLEGQKRLLDK